MGLSERFLVTGVSFLLPFLWLLEVACYCLGSSLPLRKESGRVFVVPLKLDRYVPGRDIGMYCGLCES